MFRPLRASSLLAVFALLSGCGDPYDVGATQPTYAATFSAYALNGTPVSHPTALITSQLLPVRADAQLAYDIAFDIDANGDAVIYTIRELVGELSARRVGLQHITNQTYAELVKAPGSGYRYDSLLTVPEGGVVVVQAQRPSDCAYQVSSVIYTKFVIDSIDETERLLFMRGVTDRSCGYRSFLPGIPES